MDEALLESRLACSPSSSWPPSGASGLDASRGVREEEEGREVDGGPSGRVERVEGRDVRS